MRNIIHFLNTIWSDAILLESNNHFAFIDTGNIRNYPMIKEYLNEHNVKEIDFIFLTHFHNDHYGGILGLLEDFKVNKVYLRDYSCHDGSTGNGTASSDEYHIQESAMCEAIKDKARKVSSLVMIDENFSNLDFYDFHFDVLSTVEHIKKVYNDEESPLYHVDRFNENYESVSLFTQLEGINIYLGGDITDCDNSIEAMDHLNNKAIKWIYNKYNINHIDLYKVAHHGVHDSNSEDTLALIKPTYAVITNADKWLDRYTTIPNMLKHKSDVNILKLGRNHYLFEIKDGKLLFTKLDAKSLLD